MALCNFIFYCVVPGAGVAGAPTGGAAGVSTTWPGQFPFGSASAAKYSVYFVQVSLVAINPVCLHMVFLTTPSGISKATDL